MNPLEYAERIAYSSKQVLRFTYDMAVKFKDSPGVYVECGVAAGAQIIAMAYGAPNKTIYAFDSFEGIPLPSNRDNQMPGIAFLKEWEQKALPDPGKQVLETSGATSVSEEDFWNHMDNALIPSGPTTSVPTELKLTNIRTVKGWFEETLPYYFSHNSITPFQISILRLDGDLYNSTWVCLQHLFPRVIQGGCVIIDDYGLLGCHDACKEYFELIGYIPDYKFIEGENYKVAYFFK